MSLLYINPTTLERTADLGVSVKVIDRSTCNSNMHAAVIPILLLKDETVASFTIRVISIRKYAMLFHFNTKVISKQCKVFYPLRIMTFISPISHSYFEVEVLAFVQLRHQIKF